MSYFVRRQSGRHGGGTKDYHLVWIQNSANNRHLVISRWAKAGQWGHGIKTLPFRSIPDATREWERVVKTKFEREYSRSIPSMKDGTFEDVDDLKRTLGQYWPKLGEHAEWLIPGCGMAGKPIEEPDEWTEGRRVRANRATNPDRFENVDEPPDVELLVKENPAWGSW